MSPTILEPPALSPGLAAMVAEWADVRQRYDIATQDDQSAEGDALFERILTLQPAIYAFPVASVADLCAKLPVLRDEFEDIKAGSDPASPYWLQQAADAVLRDLASLSNAPPVAEDDEPLTTEGAASLDFEAVHIPTPVRTPRQWQERFAPHTLGLHMADRVLRMSKAELVAFIRGADARDSDLPGSLINTLSAARSEAQTYAEMLDAAWTRFLVAGSTVVLADEQGDAQAQEPSPDLAAAEAAAALQTKPSLVDLVDWSSATLEELKTLLETARSIGDVAQGFLWQGRCHVHGEQDAPGESYNAAGRLMLWLSDELSAVEGAATKEARRRAPVIRNDREARLEILAAPVIQNGDPDETEAFARELLAYAEAERAGR